MRFYSTECYTPHVDGKSCSRKKHAAATLRARNPTDDEVMPSMPTNSPQRVDSSEPHDGLHWRTRLIHSAADAPPGFRSLATPVYRGSTTVFENLADAHQGWQPGGPYTY